MQPVHILLVEDNEGDIFLTTEAFENSKIRTQLSVVRDGKAAIDFLKKEGAYTNAKDADLLLLDLNLPKRNGFEVLQFVKQDTKLVHIPVIILSTSSAERDINKCYENYANCYIIKPVDIENLFTVISQFEKFWLSTVRLPMKSNS
ncbi:MAG: response regulator [Ginsengibacter sp.]